MFSTCLCCLKYLQSLKLFNKPVTTMGLINNSESVNFETNRSSHWMARFLQTAVKEVKPQRDQIVLPSSLNASMKIYGTFVFTAKGKRFTSRLKSSCFQMACHNISFLQIVNGVNEPRCHNFCYVSEEHRTFPGCPNWWTGVYIVLFF